MLALDAGGQEANRALPNAAALIAARVPINISSLPKPVGFDAEKLMDVPFLWIHGRTDFSFDDAQREVLREYVENGGVIFGSAVCGSEAFADAFRREIALVLPDAPLRAVPASHPALKRFRRFRRPERDDPDAGWRRQTDRAAVGPAAAGDGNGRQRRGSFLFTARPELCSGEPQFGPVPRIQHRGCGKNRGKPRIIRSPAVICFYLPMWAFPCNNLELNQKPDPQFNSEIRPDGQRQEKS